MISTHFDLQNIIKEMESTGNGAESSVNATGSEFSATITRVLESLPHDIESETELVDSLKAGGDESLESGKKDDGEHESGNVLPLMLSQPPSFDQLMLGGKRPILIGKLNAEQRSGISQSEATESTYALSTTQKLQDLLNSTQRLGGSGEASKPLMERLAPVGQTSITQAALANRTVPEGEGSNLSRFDKAPDRSDSLHFKFAESSKGQIEAVKASSEQIHFSKNLDRLNSVGSKFERAELAASGNGKKDGSVDSASANQQQSVLNSFTPRSALRQLQAFKGLSNEQAAPLADVQSIEVSSLKNTAQSEASIDSAMAKFDVDRFNEEVGKIVKNQLVNTFTGKNISVKMLLSPESLGQVEVDLLFSKDSEIQITLRTENAEVAKLMQANATVLRDQLAIEHKGIVALNINDSRTAEFGFQGNQRDEANREKYSVFDESDSGESNNALEKSSISGDGSNSLIDTFA
ncbi:MAG: flagellar hook-length control protein FliK [Gammaproteobacteria bacterium]|nr:flagellar hook-length control protein FliK [Gammaproteobacteria bacterium]